MKKGSKWIIVAVFLLIAVLCVLAVLSVMPVKKDAQWYADFVREYGDSIAALIAEDVPMDDPRLGRIMRRGGVEFALIGDTGADFHLKGAQLEGSYCLYWTESGEYDGYEADGSWKPVQTDDGSMRLEGGGINGAGWVQVWSLGNGFFLEETYIPT